MSSPQKAELGRFCETAQDAARAAEETPPHERGFYVAALANHVRECPTCRGALNAAREPVLSTCRHGGVEGNCGACESCAACDGSCGTCPFVPVNRPGEPTC